MVAAVVAGLVGMDAATASAAEPPTPLGVGWTAGVVAGVDAVDNQVFFDAQDLHSPAKVTFNFITTPMTLGSTTPVLIVLGVLPSGKQFLLPVPTTYTTSDSPPSIYSPVGHVTWVSSAQAFHLVVADAVSGFSADLWFAGHPGGATLPADWDGQTSYWVQSIGAGKVNGTVSFPGYSSPTTVADWGGEEETEYGTYELGPGPIPPTGLAHIGYDYAQSDNPDGSADALDVFPELDGGWRGILVHTSASGQVTECEPSQAGGIRLSNWHTDSTTGYVYPLVMSASCGSLSITWVTTPAQTEIPVQGQLDGFLVSDSAGVSSVPGSVAAMQHLRDNGHFDQMPAGSSR